MSADPCRPDEPPPPGWSHPEPLQGPEDDAEPAHHFLDEPEPEARQRPSLGGSAEMPLGLLAVKWVLIHRITTSSRSQPAPPQESRFFGLGIRTRFARSR